MIDVFVVLILVVLAAAFVCVDITLLRYFLSPIDRTKRNWFYYICCVCLWTENDSRCRFSSFLSCLSLLCQSMYCWMILQLTVECVFRHLSLYLGSCVDMWNQWSSPHMECSVLSCCRHFGCDSTSLVLCLRIKGISSFLLFIIPLGCIHFTNIGRNGSNSDYRLDCATPWRSLETESCDVIVCCWIDSRDLLGSICGDADFMDSLSSVCSFWHGETQL